MTNKYIPASCLEDLLSDVSNTECRLEYTKDESGYGDEALDAVKHPIEITDIFIPTRKSNF